MADPNKKSRFQLGIGFILFALLVAWGLWHAVIGPRVIAPTPGVVEQEAAQ